MEKFYQKAEKENSNSFRERWQKQVNFATEHGIFPKGVRMTTYFPPDPKLVDQLSTADYIVSVEYHKAEAPKDEDSIGELERWMLFLHKRDY